MAAIELSRGGWTAALGGSLLVHLTLAAAVAPLLGNAQARRAVTEITFSEPEIASLPADRPLVPVSAKPPGDAQTLAPAETSAAPVGPGTAAGLPGLRTGERAASPGDAGRATPEQAPLVAPAGAGADPATPLEAASLPSQLTPVLGAESDAVRLDVAEAALAAPISPSVALPARSASPLAPPSKVAAAAPALTVNDILAADAAAPGKMTPDGAREALSGAPVAGSAPTLTVDDILAADTAARSAAPSPDGPGILVGGTAAGALPAVAMANSAAAPAGSEAIGASAAFPARALPVELAGRLTPAASGLPARAGARSGSSPATARVISGGASTAAASAARHLAPAGVVRLEPAGLTPFGAGGGLQPAGAASVLPPLGENGGGGGGRGSAAWRETVGFVRGFGGGGCFAALPVEKDERVGLEAFGTDRREIERFAEASAGGLARPTPVLRGNLARIQCDALRLARASPLYPDFALSIALEPPADAFGLVEGEVLGAGTRAVQLLLIDETGAVQTVARYAPGPDGPLPFDFPFSREELAQARGLLFAVASDKPLSNLDFDIKNMTAPIFFGLLQKESQAADAALDIALLAFDLDPPSDAAMSGTTRPGVTRPAPGSAGSPP